MPPARQGLWRDPRTGQLHGPVVFYRVRPKILLLGAFVVAPPNRTIGLWLAFAMFRLVAACGLSLHAGLGRSTRPPGFPFGVVLVLQVLFFCSFIQRRGNLLK